MSQNWLLLANTHGRYIFIPKVLYEKKSWITWKSKVLLYWNTGLNDLKKCYWSKYACKLTCYELIFLQETETAVLHFFNDWVNF